MNLPKKIKIGFHEYKVVYPYIFSEDASRIGQCNSTIREIRIADNHLSMPIPDSSILQVAMHEVLHGIDSTSNLNLFKTEEEDVDEDKLDGFAEWLCMVLRDNPSFTKLFLEGK